MPVHSPRDAAPRESPPREAMARALRASARMVAASIPPRVEALRHRFPTRAAAPSPASVRGSAEATIARALLAVVNMARRSTRPMAARQFPMTALRALAGARSSSVPWVGARRTFPRCTRPSRAMVAGALSPSSPGARRGRSGASSRRAFLPLSFSSLSCVVFPDVSPAWSGLRRSLNPRLRPLPSRQRPSLPPQTRRLPRPRCSTLGAGPQAARGA